MLRSATLAIFSLLLLTSPALALGGNNNSYQPAPYSHDPYNTQQGDVFTGTSKSNRAYQPQNQYLEPRQFEPSQPDPQQQPSSATRIRLSGSGNGSARQAVIENNPDIMNAIGNGQMQTSDVLIGRVDLNGDGKEEIFAYNEAPPYCNGDFCPFAVYQVVRGQPLLPLLQGFMTTSEIAVLDQPDGSGWHSLVAYNMRGQEVILQFNGNEYIEPRRHRNGWR